MIAQKDSTPQTFLRTAMDTYCDMPWSNHFCSTIDPLTLHKIDMITLSKVQTVILTCTRTQFCNHIYSVDLSLSPDGGATRKILNLTMITYHCYFCMW